MFSFIISEHMFFVKNIFADSAIFSVPVRSDITIQSVQTVQALAKACFSNTGLLFLPFYVNLCIKE